MEPIHDILPLLPQQPPFVHIGELLFANGQLTRTAYHLPANNVLIDGGYWTEAGLLENMAQTVAAGAGYLAKQAGRPVEPGYIAAVKNFEVSYLPAVGQLLVTETVLKESIGAMLVIGATVHQDSQLIASCELSIFVGS